MRALLVHIVFERDGDAGKRAQIGERACGDDSIDAVGGIERKRIGALEEGMDLGFDGIHMVEMRLRDLARREFLGGEPLADAGRGHIGQVRHH